MSDEAKRLKTKAMQAHRARDWAMVAACAAGLQKIDSEDADGFFLAGLAARASSQPRKATEAFEKALQLDGRRHDAAIELANQYSFARRNGEAARLLSDYETAIQNSPRYLELAGSVYTDIGLAQKAWPLFKRAHELQPEADLFKANLATCAVFLGKIDEARELYLSLLKRYPTHRRNHYQLARLEKAKDRTHIDQMQEILSSSEEPIDRDIPLYFAIGKELEDLEQWEASFEYYRKACDSVAGITNHDVESDIQLIDSVIDTCNIDWLEAGPDGIAPSPAQKTPIFIVGLPRTGTTLTERIISSHSQVSSLGETLFLQLMLRQESGVRSTERMTPEMIQSVAAKDVSPIAQGYLDMVQYRLGDESFFIDKLPLNFLYLGFIAKAWPQARIVHLVRNPMDTCFSMYKQVFTWAYRFSYSLDDLGRYYVAYERLRRHWQSLLGDRLIEVRYEELVTDQEVQTRQLLDRLGLKFEQGCLDFDQNAAPSTTASSVQVRAKIHTSSVQRWKRYESQLRSLRQHLESAGIAIE